jgi:hypothetical protein
MLAHSGEQNRVFGQRRFQADTAGTPIYKGETL